MMIQRKLPKPIFPLETPKSKLENHLYVGNVHSLIDWVVVLVVHCIFSF